MIISAPPNDRKLSQLVLYIARESEGDDRFGSTKLNKLLFYADFIAYVVLGKSITDHEYQKLEHGPAPRAIVPVLKKMQARGELAMRDQPYFNKTQKRPVPLTEPELSEFTGSEIDLVSQLIRENWDRNASEISHRSHQFHGWEDVEERDTIKFEVALLGTRPPTKAESDRGLNLVPKAEAWLQGNA